VTNAALSSQATHSPLTGVYKNVKGTLIAKFAVLYIAAPSSDYSGEYELTFSKEVEEIAKCICVGESSTRSLSNRIHSLFVSIRCAQEQYRSGTKGRQLGRAALHCGQKTHGVFNC
jgi:hypothetical protein